METVTIPGFIYVTPGPFGDHELTFSRSDDMATYGYTKVMPHTITVEVPDDFDPNAGLVAALERKRAKALDEAAQAERELARLAQVAGKAG